MKNRRGGSKSNLGRGAILPNQQEPRLLRLMVIDSF